MGENTFTIKDLFPIHNIADAYILYATFNNILHNRIESHPCGCLYTFKLTLGNLTYLNISLCQPHRISTLMIYQYLMNDIHRFGLSKLRKEVLT